MDRTVISTDRAPKAIGPYSQAIRSGNLVFTSGQIPIDPQTNTVLDGDIVVQTERVLQNLNAVLQAANSSLAKALKVTVYLTDMNDFAKMNEVYGRYFSESKPCRSTVEVSKLPKGVRVEIDVVALAD